MKKLILSAFISFLLFSAQNVMSQTELVYGGKYHIQNGWAKWTGGFLDTRGMGCQSNLLCVSTSKDNNRDNGSGTWVILSATGKSNGTQVVSGDVIILQNQYDNGKGGFLDTREYLKNTDNKAIKNHLAVSTSSTRDRSSGSTSWTITFQNNSGWGRENVPFSLLNNWNKNQGGYLDTNGYGKNASCQDNWLCVSTSKQENRSAGSGTWRFIKAKN